MDQRTKQIHIEKIQLLYQGSFTPVILSTVVSFLLAAALWDSANRDYLRIWLGVLIALTAVRVILLINYRHHAPQGHALLKWELPYVVSLLAVVTTWSLGLILVMPRDNMASVFLMSTYAIGLAAAAMSWYGALKYLQLIAISVTLLPMITVLLTLGQREAFWIGIASACMYASCMMTSMAMHKIFNGKLELAYDLRRAKANAEDMARTDSLTGLNNRRAFFDKARLLFDICMRNQQPLTAVMLDVDHFKEVNDTYGHAAGDLVLSNLSRLLKSNLRESDLLCRFGGEEFAILLPNTDIKEAEDLANHLRVKMMSQRTALDTGEELSLTASFGVADSGSSLEDLMSHADQAMYLAKNNGRNQVTTYQTKVTTLSKVS